MIPTQAFHRLISNQKPHPWTRGWKKKIPLIAVCRAWSAVIRRLRILILSVPELPSESLQLLYKDGYRKPMALDVVSNSNNLCQEGKLR